MTATIALTVETVVTDTQGAVATYRYAKTITALGEMKRQEVSVGAGVTAIVWNPTVDTSELCESFSFLEMEASVDMEAELTINEAHANEELISLRLAAGVPLILGSNAAFYNHSASDIYAGTLDVIDKIRVKNTGASAGTLFFLIAKT